MKKKTLILFILCFCVYQNISATTINLSQTNLSSNFEQVENIQKQLMNITKLMFVNILNQESNLILYQEVKIFDFQIQELKNSINNIIKNEKQDEPIDNITKYNLQLLIVLLNYLEYIVIELNLLYLSTNANEQYNIIQNINSTNLLINVTKTYLNNIY